MHEPFVRSIRRRRPATSSAVAAAAVAACTCAALHAASVGAAEPAGSSATAPSFVGTAYQKSRHTTWFAGKSYGLAQSAARGLVAQCHAIAGASAASPPEDVLIDLDVTTHEKFFDGQRALTLISGHGLDLTDLQRWRREASGGGQPNPPDCGMYKLVDIKSGTLWRDGTRYILRYDTSKALGTHGPAAYAKRVLSTDDEWSRAPVDHVMGQSCRQVSAPPGTGTFFAGGSTCVWDRYAHVGYLNWPFALSGQVDFGGKAMVETIETLEVSRDRSMPAGVFEIPSGFKVVN